MNIIHGSIPREKTAVFNAFHQVVENRADSGTLFLAFPIVDVTGISSAVDGLLISPESGVVIFDLDPSNLLDADKIRTRQDDLYVGLQSRFIKHEGLRKDRRTLTFEINILTFAPFASTDNTTAIADVVTTGADLLERLDQLSENSDLENTVVKQITSVVQAVDKIRGAKKSRTNATSESRASILGYIESQIANLDRFQNKAIVETTESPQRIRGLAGCGKTIVVASKAAYLHATNPDLVIVVTFYTRALYGHLRNLIQRFYSAYTNTLDEPNWSNLKVMHAWGSNSNAGVYFEIAKTNSLKAYDFQGASSTFGSSNAFSGSCNELATNLKEPIEIYDIVIIDEAQDMPQGFYDIVYASTRQPKRIIWAYDELQKLDTEETMPPPEELFGQDDTGTPRVTLKNEAGKPSQDIVLPVCYRNPREILVVAHALGFGIYRKEGLIQMINDAELWTDIGYEFELGEPTPTSEVILSRRTDASPSFLSEHDKRYPIINSVPFGTSLEQANWIAASIAKNITEDQLEHTDILVIHPDPWTTKSAVQPLQRQLTQLGIPNHVAGIGYDRDQFFVTGSIVISHIFRAKGNEAAIVYVMDAHSCADGNELIKKRNVLFTAITRARAWVNICGVGSRMLLIQDEVEATRQNGYKLHFQWPTPEEQDKLRNLHRELTPEEKQARTKGQKNLSELTKLLLSQKLSIDDLPAEELENLRRLLERTSK